MKKPRENLTYIDPEICRMSAKVFFIKSTDGGFDAEEHIDGWNIHLNFEKVIEPPIYETTENDSEAYLASLAGRLSLLP